MLQKLMWGGLLLGLGACAVRHHEIQEQLREVRAETMRIQAERKALDPKLVPVEQARTSIHAAMFAIDIKEVILKKRAPRLRVLQGLRGLPVQALEWDAMGFYVETREARKLQRRLPTIPRLSVEPGRLAGRWP